LPGFLQRKLAIGEVNDPLEHEADRVADQVMRMPAPELAANSVPPRISRPREGGGRPQGKVEASPIEAPASVHEVLRSSGQPLDQATRAYFEPRFGHDFSRVRVHSNEAAAGSARDVNASAYTVGHNMVFDAGRFTPGTHEGRRLISHELTHVVQQGGMARALQRSPPNQSSDPAQAQTGQKFPQMTR
jgi:hypothetical protein